MIVLKKGGLFTEIVVYTLRDNLSSVHACIQEKKFQLFLNPSLLMKHGGSCSSTHWGRAQMGRQVIFGRPRHYLSMCLLRSLWFLATRVFHLGSRALLIEPSENSFAIKFCSDPIWSIFAKLGDFFWSHCVAKLTAGALQSLLLQ